MEGMLTYAMQAQAAQAESLWVSTWLHVMAAWQTTLALDKPPKASIGGSAIIMC